MIAYLSGTLAAVDAGAAVIEANGIGFSASMSNRALSRLPQVGSPCRIFTYLQVREDGISLFGFLSQEEKDLFLKLIGVGGIGPKVALAALSTFEPAELAEAIVQEDVKAISRIPGVGKKSASRIVLELKGSLGDVPGIVQTSLLGGDDAAKRAAETLMAMGFSPTETEVALRGAPAGADEMALVRYALKQIGS